VRGTGSECVESAGRIGALYSASKLQLGRHPSIIVKSGKREPGSKRHDCWRISRCRLTMVCQPGRRTRQRKHPTAQQFDGVGHLPTACALSCQARRGQVNSVMSIGRPVLSQRRPDQPRAAGTGTRAVSCGVRPVVTTSGFRGHDPMSFGAYRRYQPSTAVSPRGTRTAAGGTGRRTGTAYPSPAGTKGKKKRDLSTERFYNALKKLGSGPSEKVSSGHSYALAHNTLLLTRAGCCRERLPRRASQSRLRGRSRPSSHPRHRKCDITFL
jgi:hypothetical protein